MKSSHDPGEMPGRTTRDGVPGSVPLDVERVVDERGVTVVVAGELDIFSSPKLAETLSDLDGEADAGRIVLDLSGLVFMDSIGLACLITADRDARAKGRAIHLRGIRGQVQMLLGLSGLADRFVFED